MRHLRRFHGKGEREDELIFGITVSGMGLFIQRACAAAGLVGSFGTHSMRIGGAQELAIRGFSLIYSHGCKQGCFQPWRPGGSDPG